MITKTEIIGKRRREGKNEGRREKGGHRKRKKHGE